MAFTWLDFWAWLCRQQPPTFWSFEWPLIAGYFHGQIDWRAVKISSLSVTIALMLVVLAITAPGIWPQTPRETQRELGELTARTRNLEDFRGEFTALKLDARITENSVKLDLLFDQVITLTRIVWTFLAGLVVFFLREFYGQVRKAKPDG